MSIEKKNMFEIDKRILLMLPRKAQTNIGLHK